MLTIWSPKGGSGTSVVAAAVALHLARAGGARLVDLGGDQPALLGVASEPGPGVLDWLAVADSPPGALERLGVEAAPGLVLLTRGTGPAVRPLSALVDALRAWSLPTVVDAGPAAAPEARAVVEGAGAAVVVLRPCYLALRRAVADPLTARCRGLVVVEGPGRALGVNDVRNVVGLPVLARLAVRPAVARAVDAGSLPAHVPDALAKAAAAVAAVAAPA